MDECRERHPVHDLYPVGLVRLSMSAFGFLAFQRRPHRLPQNKEIGDPLDVLRIIVQDHAIGEHDAKLVLQLSLEIPLYLTHVPPFVKL
jgi:hypothetical protein